MHVSLRIPRPRPTLNALGLSVLLAGILCQAQDAPYISIDNVPASLTITAGSLCDNQLVGNAPVSFTAHANIPWTVLASLTPASNLPEGVSVSVNTPVPAGGTPTAATVGTLNVSCTAPLLLGPIPAASKIRVGVIVLTIAAGL